MRRLLNIVFVSAITGFGALIGLIGQPGAEADTPKTEHKNYTESVTGKDGEKAAFERFVDWVVARRGRYPGLHVGLRVRLFERAEHGSDGGDGDA